MPELLWVNVTYIARLIKRLNLSLTKRLPEAMPFSGQIVPITNVDTLLRTLDIYDIGTVAITGTGNKDILTVPAGKRWVVHQVRAERSTGDRTITDIFLKDVAGHFTPIATAAASSTLSSGIISPIEAAEGWVFMLGLTGGSSDGNWKLKLILEVTDSYE